MLVPASGMEALEYLIPISLDRRRAAGHRDLELPPDDLRLPPGRRLLRRLPGEPRGRTRPWWRPGRMLVDYVLTVAVSISAGVAAITSAVPELRDHRVLLCLVFITLLTLANLRGLKEAGRIFAVPTYLYILSLGGAASSRAWSGRYTGDLDPLPVDEEALDAFTPSRRRVLGGVTVFALMRAFSSGAVALTGVEAISNGVPAFRRPRVEERGHDPGGHGHHPRRLLLRHLGARPPAASRPCRRTRRSCRSWATPCSGGTAVAYIVLQASTAAILVLAANTAYAAFPTMCSIIARDGYLPRQLFNRGDRLVFSNGILVLAARGRRPADRLRRASPPPSSRSTPSGVFTVVHAVPGGHGALPPAGAAPGVAGPGHRQRRRRGHHRDGARRRRDLEVHHRRLDPGRAHPRHDRCCSAASTGTTSGSRERLAVPDGWKPPRHQPHRGGAGRAASTGACSRRWPTPGRWPRTTWWRSRSSPTRRAGGDREAVGPPRGPRALDIVYSPYRELSRPILRFLDELDAR